MAGADPPYGPESQQPTSDGSPSESRYRPPSSAPLQGHFEPGQVLAGRYRTISLIGKGGMGEVYRADDLELEQVVALKFLPLDLTQNPDRLRRFRAEVRLTRQVSHPNVCRVYDIAEAEGRIFIAMELIHGEDLSSLLRRIGRLPEDKALEIARQLCAGLAAAHDQGVVHRDLKPANVMIDERGRARITDFGVAAELNAETMERAGTPMYMAPEQLERGEATIKSDIYSLGLVLYELFTGKPVLSARTVNELLAVDRSTSSITSPRSHVTTLDPIVEAAIMRCLEPEPEDRPASSLAVAASLPGGDPLAHALAAGETPSPQLVAASGGSGAMKPLIAAALVATTLVAALAQAVVSNRTNLLSFAKPELSSAILEDRARSAIEALGHGDVPVADDTGQWSANFEFLEHIRDNDDSVDRWERLRGERPGALRFVYRQSPRPFTMLHPSRQVLWPDSRASDPGIITVELDSKGRVIRFEAVPPSYVQESLSETEPDWSQVFEVTEFDPQLFEESDVVLAAAPASTIYRAWRGDVPSEGDPEDRTQSMFVFAGAALGKVNFIDIQLDWEERPQSLAELEDDAQDLPLEIIGAFFAVFILGGGSVLSYRNIKLGRADLRTANRLAIVIFLLGASAALLHAHSIPPPVDFIFNDFPTYGAGLAMALATWLAYVALEPYARRRIPGSLVGWTRLFSGKFNDPMVGSDILIGMCAASIIGLIASFQITVEMALGVPPATVLSPSPRPVHSMSGFHHAAHDLLNGATMFLAAVTWLTIMVMLLELFVRIRIIAVALLLLLFTVADYFNPSISGIGLVFGVVFMGSWLAMLYWRGLLAMAALALTLTQGLNALQSGLLTEWYSPWLWLAIIPNVLLLIYAYRVATAGQSLFITEAERAEAPKPRR